MFVRSAQQFRASSLLLIPLLAVLLWLPGFYLGYQPHAHTPMPLMGLLSGFVEANPHAARIIALIIVLGEAFLLNYTMIEHQVLTKKTYLPALFFVTLTGCSMGLLRMHPALLANVFLLGALRLLFGSYRMDKAFGKVFNAGVLIALASLFYFPAAVFALFAFVCLVLLRPFIWREWAIMLLGFAFPYCYAATYYLWIGKPSELWIDHILMPVKHKDFFLALPSTAYLLTIMLGVLLLAAAGRFVSGAGTATLKTKKGISVMVWFLFFSVVSFALTQDFGVAGTVMAAIPLSVFISQAFLLARRVWLMELIFLLVLAGVAAAYWPYYKHLIVIPVE